MKRFPPFRDPSSVTPALPKPASLITACGLLTVLGAALALSSCVDTSEGPCQETLSCADAAVPLLDNECVWRLPDGTIWEGGPQWNEEAQTWYWPSGERSETQNFDCGEYERSLGGTGGTSGAGGADNNAGNGGMGGAPMSSDPDAGLVDQTDCTLPNVGCDEPLVCDTVSRTCVDCLTDEECSGDTPACDTDSNTCVACIEDSHCQALDDGARPFCRQGDTPDENACVQCTDDTTCSDPTPVCNVAAGDCTVRCTSDAECAANSETPRCDTSTNQCVQCLNDDQCGSFQCQSGTQRCVPCINDSACGGSTPICESGKATCVQCLDNGDCRSGPPFCDTSDRTCVECIGDGQCTTAAAARCNLASNVCAPCNADSQCSSVSGGRDRCRVDDGQCVQCINNGDCSLQSNGRVLCADIGPLSSSCVQCDEDNDCSDINNSRCDVNAGNCAGCVNDGNCSHFADTPNCFAAQSRCVECVDSEDCGNGSRPACKTDTNRCVECVVDANCNGNSSGPVCDTARNQCVECLDNGDCGGDTPICDTSVNQCVQCLNDGQCTDPAASNCDEPNKTCVACSQNSECGGITGTNINGDVAFGVCDQSGGSGVCVQCTGLDFGGCGGFVCDSVQKACSTFAQDSSSRCGECVSDAQCPDDFSCVPETFNGQSLGPKCFPHPNDQGGCLRPFSNSVTRASLDNPSVPLCMLRSTTCDARLDTGLVECGNDDNACGVPALGDGVCVAGICSTPCDGIDDCDGNRDCVDGECVLN